LLGVGSGLTIRCLRVAHLEVVLDTADARDMADDGLGQLARGIARHRAGEGDLALDRRGGDHVVFERSGGVEGVDYVHLDLAVAALDWLGCGL
jgi:hypothetical protein